MEKKEDSLALEILRNMKRIIIILIIALIITNIAWLWYFSQYDTMTETEQTIEDIDAKDSDFNQSIR